MAFDIRTKSTARIEIPVQFSRLRDIGYNLWWTWTPAAARLFETIEPTSWARYRNPIEVLIDVEPERWQQLQSSRRFVIAYRDVVRRFDDYMFPESPTWFEQHFPEFDRGPIAYFSTEYGWHESLQVYSGGLGVLSGDHCKSASDLDLPFIGVGLMYRRGYFRQTVDADGQQQHFYPDHDVHRVPLLPVVDASGNELKCSVPFPDRDVHFRVWKASVGRVPVLLLDTDVADNDPADRPITSILYVSGREMRLCQEMLLGIGGFRVLRALGVAPSVWHMNEGHSALLALERIRDQQSRSGASFDEACGSVARDCVFTTHTPVPAGNETFPVDLVRRYLGAWSGGASDDVAPMIALGNAGDESQFNLTALALRTSARCNGVSELHGSTADGMWRHLLGERHVEAITNGVHYPSWIGGHLRDLFERRLGSDCYPRLFENGFAEGLASIPDREIWEAHQAQKSALLGHVRDRTRSQFARHGRSPDELRALDGLCDPDVLLVGFARRFATYKRADLILRDLERLRATVASAERPVQFVFAGKAHPADRPGQDLIRRIWQAGTDPSLHGRVLFLENYDIHVARYLVRGVDLWLNTPRRPLEASGTSGMKAAMNGVLNCSVLDGWWCEGYDPAYGWMIGSPKFEGDEAARDAHDADALYHLLADEIAPCYYDRGDDGLPGAWIARMKASMGALTPRFSTVRMVREYAERYYLPAGATAGSGS